MTEVPGQSTWGPQGERTCSVIGFSLCRSVVRPRSKGEGGTGVRVCRLPRNSPQGKGDPLSRTLISQDRKMGVYHRPVIPVLYVNKFRIIL